MGIFSVTMKTHSREDITAKFKNLNECIVHHVKPTIHKVVVGKSRDVHYIAFCQHDDCGKITNSESEIEKVWNRWNPKPPTNFHIEQNLEVVANQNVYNAEKYFVDEK